MTVKQISVFIENKPGTLAECLSVLKQNDLNMRALYLAETTDFGIARLIADDSYKTVRVLKEAGYVCSITPVLAVAISDVSGSLLKILDIMSEHNINLEYTYAFAGRRKDKAYMVLRVGDVDNAIKLLEANDIKLISQDELSEI